MRENPQGVKLFFLAFLTLYLELALIRYAAAEVRYLGYFSNFILVSAFLGVGTGFLAADARVQLFRHLPWLLLSFLVLVTIASLDVTLVRNNIGQLYFGHTSSSPPWLMAIGLVFIFVLSALLFASISQQTARAFRHFAPLTAYSIDIAGSLAGIVVFTAHSLLQGSHIAWFVVSWVLIVVLSESRQLQLKAGVVGVIAATFLTLTQFHHLTENPYSKWSPYQRIDVSPISNGYRLDANGIGHQNMAPVGSREAFYDFPYAKLQDVRVGKGYEDILVIGAGGGTDVSYALAHTNARIDAVEIDPQILAAGELFHPNRPYSSGRVTTYVDDGRVFMQNAGKRYDLVVFALPDSLVAYSNMANIRLESFLFTMESLQLARGLLKQDGVVVLYNYYRKQWLVDKIATMLREVFGRDPIVEIYDNKDGTMLAALAAGPTLEGTWRSGSEATALPTDNWPFLYMQAPRLPWTYGLVILLFLCCGSVAVRLTGRVSLRDFKANGPFFLMGAAFLLLETKSIVHFSLLFGATWLVNSLVFFAILASVLLANVVVAKVRPKTPFWPFVLLSLALATSLAIPAHRLLEVDSYALRYLLAGVVIFSPVFCANLLFGTLFRGTTQSTTAFGWNVIGTMAGGALEYTSIAIGYQALGYMVAVLYLATAVWAFVGLRARGDTNNSDAHSGQSERQQRSPEAA